MKSIPLATYTLIILFAGSAIVFSFLCSLWESVLLSITPAYVHEQEEKGSRLGTRLIHFKANIDVPLSAILTLNTIAHTVGAIGVGEQASTIWSDSSPVITGIVVPVAMTLAVLILSEIIPKTLGANYWSRFAPFTVLSLDILITILYPLIWLIQFLTRRLRKDKTEPVLTRSQFMTMAEVGEKEGILNEQESLYIRSLLRYREIRVRDVMTPRTVTRMAPETMTTQEFMEKFPDSRFSRIPVFEDGNPDLVSGYVLKDDVLEQLSTGVTSQTLGSLKRDILVLLETFKIPDLFQNFLNKREHIALVVDEFGGMLGIVTMEDVIETMLGLEIVDEKDRTEDMQELARRAWKRRANRMGLTAQEKQSPDLKE